MVVLYHISMAQGTSQSPDEELYRGDVNPRLGARNRSLEILCQAAISIEPSQGSFDDPAARQQYKAGSVSGAFDDLDGRSAPIRHPSGRLRSALRPGSYFSRVILVHILCFDDYFCHNHHATTD